MVKLAGLLSGWESSESRLCLSESITARKFLLGAFCARCLEVVIARLRTGVFSVSPGLLAAERLDWKLLRRFYAFADFRLLSGREMPNSSEDSPS